MKDSWHEDFVTWVKAEYEILKSRNPRYSLRAFAKRLGLSSGGLSDLLNGKTAISFRRALDIVNSLETSSNLKPFVLYKMKRDPGMRARRVSDDLFVDPLRLPVLHAFDSKPKPSHDELASRFSTSKDRIANVVNDLVEAKYLIRVADEVTPASEGFSCAKGLSPETGRQFHEMNIDLVGRKLKSGRFDLEDMDAMTFAASSADRDLIRDEVQSFFRRIAAIAAKSESKDKVLRICTQILTLDESES